MTFKFLKLSAAAHRALKANGLNNPAPFTSFATVGRDISKTYLSLNITPSNNVDV